MRWLAWTLLAALLAFAAAADHLPEIALFGRDRMGHNQLQQLALGARTSLLVGLGATALMLAVGGGLGLLAGMDSGKRLFVPRWLALSLPVLVFAGWFYGWRVWAGLPERLQPSFAGYFGLILLIISLLLGVGWLLSRLLRFLQKRVQLPVAQGIVAVAVVLDSLPPLLVVLAMSAIVDEGRLSTALIIGLTGWTGIARLTQLTVQQTLAMPYIEAAQVAGASPLRIALRHIWPAVARLLAPLVPVTVAGAILAEGTLSFLGEGVGEAHISWGSMLAQSLHQYHGWPYALQAGTAIFITVLALNYLKISKK